MTEPAALRHAWTRPEVEAIEGSYSNVVGLPLFETVELLRGFGVDPLVQRVDGWRPA